MIWLTSTNYFAVQLTHAVGNIITWPTSLNLKDLESKQIANQSAKKSTKQGTNQNDEINTSNLGSDQAIVILGGG